jgi:glutamine amidotransferase
MYNVRMVGVIDYNAGNITSVEHALNSLGIKNIRSNNPSDLENADRLIFPGVGNAHYAMREIKKTGFDVFLQEQAARGKPILGICLGSQIIFDYSEEGDTQCLGLVRGTVRRLDTLWASTDSTRRAALKIPHMGWNDIEPTEQGKNCPLFSGCEFPAAFYFVHSYAIVPQDGNVIAGTADYGVPVPAALWSKNIFALQFHPEKSGKAGLLLLKNFCKR